MAEVQFIYTTLHLLQLIGNIGNCWFAIAQSVKSRDDVNLNLPSVWKLLKRQLLAPDSL
jgi:hypothetical protein